VDPFQRNVPAIVAASVSGFLVGAVAMALGVIDRFGQRSRGLRLADSGDPVVTVAGMGVNRGAWR